MLVRAAAGFVLLLSAACDRPHTQTHGTSGEVNAEFSGSVMGMGGKLSADLPAEIGVLTTKAAAESTLRSRGYVITKSGGTKDSMSVTGKYAGSDGPSSPIEISARLVGGDGGAQSDLATQITVNTGFFGDESTTRAILDAMLRTLGR